MKKVIIIIAVLLVVVVATLAVLYFYFMGKPLYSPGMVCAGQKLRAPLTPPVQIEEANFWNVEGDIELHHFEDGSGEDVLVLHGGPGYPFNAPLQGLQPLTDMYRFVYYHQRGCGKSSRPIDVFTSSNFYSNMTNLEKTLGLGSQIADIERIRQILGQEKLILLGHSFGGFLATLYAAEFPERVKGLILVAPANLVVMPPEDGGLYEQVRELLPEEMKEEYSAYMKEYFDYKNMFSKTEADLAELNARFVKYYGAAAEEKGLTIPAADTLQDYGGWVVHAMMFSMGKRHNYRDALKAITAPVLVIHGQNDLQPVDSSRAYAEYFSNHQFRVIENASHFVFDEQPERFATVVGAFLEELK